MKEVKRFVVLDTGAIIDLATYVMGTWGSNDQCGVTVKGNKVYETYWSYGGDCEEDVSVDVLLGTVLCSSSKPFHILESCSSPTVAKHDYKEYGVDLENNESRNKK